MPPYSISRPPSPGMPPNASPLTQRQQRQLRDAYDTINKLQNQLALQTGGPMPPPYGPPVMNPPMPYPRSPLNSYPPPSPLLQRLTGRPPMSYPGGSMNNSSAFRDTDYAAIANIAGLNPADVALLHREYSNLTRGGIHRLDRVVFRQLLREAMIEANSENVDRAIENIFVSIDRNHDGFIDFPEFIGAFRDILKGTHGEADNYLLQQGIPDLISEQRRNQQAPIVYSSPSPLVLSLDSNSSPYIVSSQGQQLTAPQCVPLQII